MGFDVQGLRFLLSARHQGVRLDKTALIGRQELFIDTISLRRIFRCFGLTPADAELRRILTEQNGFAEPLLRLLGAEEICSVDASPYEDASVVHDMNLPIPSGLRGGFSTVIDAGTLEHVFDFPSAIRNCMEMVREGGHLLLMTPANNFMGHGFYQFSPELFFRVCSEPNGFMVERAIVCEVDPSAHWFEVIDPARVRRRVELVTSRPAYLLVQARKLRQAQLFATPPQQSDYQLLWAEGSAAGAHPQPVARPLPYRLLRGLGRRLRSAYRMIEPSALAARRLRPDRSLFAEVSWCPTDGVRP